MSRGCRNSAPGLSSRRPGDLLRPGEGLPISDASLDRIRRENKRDFKRPLLLEDWQILEVIRRGEPFERSADQEERFRLLLESRTILQYVHDEEWYGLNPFVEMLTPPTGLASNDSTP